MNKPIFAALAIFSMAACSGPSEEKLKEASTQCEAFIAKEMEGRGSRGLETKIFDIWTKNGAIVMDIGYKEKYSSKSYSVRKCVFDEVKGTISSPSPLNDSQWRK